MPSRLITEKKRGKVVLSIIRNGDDYPVKVAVLTPENALKYAMQIIEVANAAASPTPEETKP